MKLTGQAKEAFEDYLEKQSIEYDPKMELYPKTFLVENFSRVPFSMQWGVYVDFFDGEGVKLSVTWLEDNYWTEVQIEQPNPFSNWIIRYEEQFETLVEARISTLERANEIYNGAKNKRDG